ncbi:MAG: type II toxin-antitoxin system prevent-host-death family antitoxin [Rhodospirillales bacterium]|nr:type II toxin-antitoxin system prevent-host-death family antitoxin [Rhodospirillales bacterium]MBI2585307.1 type II toxin-antitoxin system prevent-host-death family antitoxin [Rhodospirillales bacterium]
MKTVSAREANQHFSRLLKAAAEGEDVVITRRGKPVAKLVAVAGPKIDAKRRAAIKRLMKMLRKGYDLGGLRIKREELYDR